MKQFLCTCDCCDDSHIIVLRFDDDEDVPELYISVQLNPSKGLWSRLKIALRYIAGKRSHFGWDGHWDSGGISPESARAAEKLIQEYLVAEERSRA